MSKSSWKKIKNRIPYDIPQLEHYDSSSVIKTPDKFEILIDRQIKSLRKQGVDVAICPDYLDSFVENHIASLFNAIESKHRKNMDFIKNIFVRRAIDKKEFERLLSDYETEIASTYEDYKSVKELYEKHNPLRKGRLNLDPFTEESKNQATEEENEDEDEEIR
ncbi:hypothetical protein [Enterocloster bolteae]|uniref:hypothetical protein n=1 Tax=Enterocloster bolteae TaxID=208479 RepID=UPI002108FD59|nr:hypothetical protein [Enterocloster bolteae]MCQ5142416.1 hypothetical protein [Enterocloster bolteae]